MINSLLDVVSFLQRIPDLTEFTEDEITVLARAMSVDAYPDDHKFIVEGERGDTLFLLLEGSVLITRRSEGQRCAEFIERLHVGAMFGLLSLIDSGPRAASCVAKGPVTIASLPRSAFNLLTNTNAGIGQHFQYLIALQLARDTRIFNQAIQAVMKTGSQSQFYGILRAISYEYRGPERRMEDRRRGYERRL